MYHPTSFIRAAAATAVATACAIPHATAAPQSSTCLHVSTKRTTTSTYRRTMNIFLFGFKILNCRSTAVAAVHPNCSHTYILYVICPLHAQTHQISINSNPKQILRNDHLPHWIYPYRYRICTPQKRIINSNISFRLNTKYLFWPTQNSWSDRRHTERVHSTRRRSPEKK